MATDAQGRAAIELRSRSAGLAFAAPRTAAIVRGLADAVVDDAALSELLGPGWLDRPLAGVRLLAGVHDLVITGQAPELKALACQSGPFDALADDGVLWKAARQVIFDHPGELRSALDWPVQQHLPDRASPLLAGLAMLGQPQVRLLELGACAGLTLQFDRYLWQGEGWAWGASDSPVRLPAGCPAPPPGLTIVERGGCDIAPVDPRDPVMVRRLHAFVPHELSTTHRQLNAALRIAASQPPQVDRAPAQQWLERQLCEEPAPGVRTVVWHSHLWQLLDQAERDGIRRALFAAARRYPVTRISYEPYEPGGPVTLIVESFP